MADDLDDPFNELVVTWNPDWLKGTSEAIRRCWKEVKEQFPGNELQLLATEFHERSVEHVGTSAPTFIELVCMCLAKPLCLIGEEKCTERTRREAFAELMKVDAGFLSAEIGRELSWLVLNHGEGTFTRSHESDGRLVGVFGLVSIIGETADWIRSMVKVEQTGSPSPVVPPTTLTTNPNVEAMPAAMSRRTGVWNGGN
ncbi:MAG: hypothetical protein JSS49_01435 [Planctomycetes bacterium]|nr:hypothetical protein [Planctomycetota bacterium]